jgi:ketosteroid isomerase-like protein
MDRGGFEDWLRRYFDAWVSNDPVDVAALFTEDALYWVGPFREPTSNAARTSS